MVQEEGTLWTFHDTSRNLGVVFPPFDRTFPLSTDAGYEYRTDFRAILFLLGGLIHFPILGENKAAISREDTADSGWPANLRGRHQAVKMLQHAIVQVELQSVVLYKTDSATLDLTTRQSVVCLMAAVGLIYTVAFATRSQIEQGYADVDATSAAKRLHQLRVQETRMAQNEPVRPPQPAAPDDMDIDYTSFDATKFAAYSRLPQGAWSEPVLLDTPKSDDLLLGLQQWDYLMRV
jgi:hypothetical protein